MNIKIKKIIVKYLEYLFILIIGLLLTIIFKNKLSTGIVIIIMNILYITKDLILRDKSIIKKIFGLKILNQNDSKSSIIKILLRPIFDFNLIDTILIIRENENLSDLIFKTKVDEIKENKNNIVFNIIGLISLPVLVFILVICSCYIYFKLEYYETYYYYDELPCNYMYSIDDSMKEINYSFKYYRKISEKDLKKESIEFKKDKNEKIESLVNNFYKNNKIDEYYIINFEKEYIYYYEEGRYSDIIIVYVPENKKLYIFEYTKKNV